MSRMNVMMTTLTVALSLMVCGGAIAADPQADRSWWETGYDASYSPDNPPGPSFSEGQKQEQREAGLKLLADLRAAYAADADSFTIPPGDYRFGTKYKGADSFVLKDMDRDGKTAFRILGYGATLWFDLIPEPGPKVNYLVQMKRCSNISLEGVIIDSDRGVMEARITAFDFSGNRIQVEPLEGTRRISSVPGINSYVSNRFIPYKANGFQIASYFQIDETSWGPGAMEYKNFTVTEDGRYWFEMNKPHLLDTIRNPVWREVYGSEGTLETGDLLCFTWSNSRALDLIDCKQITVKDCKIYTKSVIYESGHGGNKFLNCHLTPRPKTNNLQGGDGGLSSDCLVGSLIDGQVHHRSTDDPWNYRTIWRYVESIDGRSVTFKRPPVVPTRNLWQFDRGDKAEFYDIETKQLIGVFSVDSAEGATVTFQESLDGVSVKDGAVFPRYQNNGWIVRNCLFIDCYQRFLIHAGEGGLFENNRMERFGSNPLQIVPFTAGAIEAGLPDNLIIRNNLIVDSGVTPAKSTIKIEGGGRPIRNLTFSGNLICNSGRESVMSTLVGGLTLEDNIVVNPFDAVPLRPEPVWTNLPAFTLDRVNGATIRNNTVVRRDTRSSVVGAKESSDITEEDNTVRHDPDEALEARIRALTATHDRDARSILEEIKKELQ